MSDSESAFGDAVYDTWMQGGNPDLVSRGRLQDHMDQGAVDWDQAVEMEVSRVLRTPTRRER